MFVGHCLLSIESPGQQQSLHTSCREGIHVLIIIIIVDCQSPFQDTQLSVTMVCYIISFTFLTTTTDLQFFCFTSVFRVARRHIFGSYLQLTGKSCDLKNPAQKVSSQYSLNLHIGDFPQACFLQKPPQFLILYKLVITVSAS